MDGRDERQVKKSRNWIGTESLFLPDTLSDERKHDRAEFGAEVAEENERIATKPRRLLLDPMRTHYKEPCSCESPSGSEGKERVKPVMLSTDTPASIVAVPYSTWFTTVITGTSAVGPGDSRFDPVTAGTL
ncbi:hypothetical protein PIB30_022569 [Stylosanthes scabra]|uniref:Uncharacterized protein n=1 Tax=Stylosanthes scabra TaxID=79078 RepID=A0ABU6Y870_9FABA|nr:hypothetical protein [Stylosanthes scabra]